MNGNGDSAHEIVAPDEREVVLLCNPRAGGRWKELAAILDSTEARHVRRVVTDSIADVGPALADVDHRTQLVCIYGGDGTIQRVLDHLLQQPQDRWPLLGLIGGGTMNVTARWCGMTATPARNFQTLMQAYLSGELLAKEVPLLEVREGQHVRRGFTFGMGPAIRVLDRYENGTKGKVAASMIAAKSLSALWSGWPQDLRPLLEEMDAEVRLEGEALPYSRYSAIFCNVTGKIHVGIDPFVKPRSRDSFYVVAYAATGKEVALLLPFLARGRIPIDPKSLLKPVSTWTQVALAYLGRGSFPVDPRYVNEVAMQMEIRTGEPIYTLDGEIVHASGLPIAIGLGPRIKLAVSPTVGLGPTVRLAAEVGRAVSRARVPTSELLRM